MWHYQNNNKSIGPINLSEVETLIQKGKIARSTIVWREGMTDWLPAIETELQSSFPQNMPPPVGPPSLLADQATSSQLEHTDDIKRLDNWFLTYWICLAAGIPLSLVFIGIVGIIAAVVFYCLMIHKLWSLIPTNTAKTTPGKAVGFLFIPFFNLYWSFVAFHGLAQALNAETRRHSIPNKEINEGMSLTYCILTCCSMIPYLGILTSIVGFVIGIITLKQMKDAGIALIQEQTA